MLSRVAESLYWMNRYVERAENVARFVGVNLQLMLDEPSGADQQWQPLVNTTGDHADFAARYSKATQENVIQFLAFDAENPNSILSCLRAARENARSVREIISSEMWLQLNTFYLMVKSVASSSKHSGPPHEFFNQVKMASHLFVGITQGTMTRGEPWHFSRLGRRLERADKTSRLLDVKYFILLRSIADVGTPLDDIQWAAVLRSASAFEMYRKRHGRIAPANIVDFLLLDRDFPRAIHRCLLGAREELHAISGTPIGTFHFLPEKVMGQLCSDLSYASLEEIMNGGLHEYLDELQTRMNLVGHAIHETFFALKSPQSMKRTTKAHAQ